MRTKKQIQKVYDFHLGLVRDLSKGRGHAWEKYRHETAVEILAWVMS
jgi:hypothetical protein